MITRKLVSENSDATTTYDIEFDCPVNFEELLAYVKEKDNSYSIEFIIDEYFFDYKVNIVKDKKTNEWCFSDKVSKRLYSNVKNTPIKKCWANGGWGRMKYYVTV